MDKQQDEVKKEKYEYTTVYYENSDLCKKWLAEIGLEGWKMVGVSSDNRGNCLMFFIRVLT